VKPFREQNKAVIGGIGVGVILGALALSFQTDKLPVIGFRDIVKAEFSEAAGLRPSDEVRVAGVKVGKVTGVDLSGDHVLVTMRLKDVDVGTQSRADIRIKTVLGRKFVALEPEGPGELDTDTPIPLSRTSSPYDVAEAFQGLASNIEEINTERLAKSFTVLADTFRDTPDEVRASLNGLSRLSNTIASRDAELKKLLSRARGVSGVLAERDQDLVQVLDNSSLILEELRKRREVIDSLLTTTTQLSEQLVALVRENRATLKPALDRLRGVVTVLREQQDNLDKSLVRLAPFVRVFSNNLGNGRWFDTLIYNVGELPTFQPRTEFPCGEFNMDTQRNCTR